MKGYNKYSDEELIQGIYNHDSRIIQSIINECYPLVKKLVLSRNGSELDVDDAIQEAIIVLYRKIREESFISTGSIKSYLLVIARNQWYLELKRRNGLFQISDRFDVAIDIDDETLQLIEKNDRYRLFREKFEELSDSCKKVIRMYLMKVPISEITRILGYTSTQITRNRRFKCKEELIRKIKRTSMFKELGHENNQRN